MDCPKCGAKNTDNAEFCSLCLERFPRPEPVPVPTARVPTAEEHARSLNVPLAAPPSGARVPSWAVPKFREASEAIVRGNTLMRRGDAAGACARYEIALEMMERVFGMDAVELEPAYENLYQSYEALGDTDNATRTLGHLLVVSEQAHGAASLQTAPTLHRLGKSELDRGAYSDAEGHFRAALDIFTAALGATSRPATIVELDLTTTLLALGRHEEAEDMLRDSIAAMKARGETGTQLALRLENLAAVCAMTLREPEAADLRDLAEATRLPEETPAPDTVGD